MSAIIGVCDSRFVNWRKFHCGLTSSEWAVVMLSVADVLQLTCSLRTSLLVEMYELANLVLNWTLHMANLNF